MVCSEYNCIQVPVSDGVSDAGAVAIENPGLFLATVPLIFVVLYAIIGGISFGMPIHELVRSKPLLRQPDAQLHPVWESSYVFLVGAAAAGLMLFPAGLSTIGPLLLPLWLVAAAIVGLRSLLIALHYYGGVNSVYVRWSLAVASLALPAVLMQTITILLTGENNLMAHTGLVIALGTLGAVLSVAVWGGYFYRPGKVSKLIGRLSYWLALLLSLFTLPLAIVLDGTVLDGRSLIGLMWPVVLAVVCGILSLASEHRLRYFTASSLLIVGVSSSLFLTLWPYLLRPVLRFDGLLAGNSVAQVWIAFGFTSLVIIILPALYYLHSTSRRP